MSPTNTLNTPQKSLITFILNTLKIVPVKAQSGKGFMLYTIPTKEEISKLTTLVSDLKSSWKLIQSDEAYKPNGEKRPASIYIGHADSKNDMKVIDDFVALDFS